MSTARYNFGCQCPPLRATAALRPAGGGHVACHPARVQRAGFTMVEMLVTIAISIILLAMINVMFRDVQVAVTRGSALSDMMASARSVSDNLTRDAQAMLPRSQGGYLALSNAQENFLVIPPGGGIASTRPVNIGQLAFIRRRESMQPVCSSTNYSTSSRASYVIVYYGHGLRTAPDGASADALGSGLNQRANEWLLARHRMFLAEPGYTHALPASTYQITETNTSQGRRDTTNQFLSNVSTTGLIFANSNRIWINATPQDFTPALISQGHAFLAARVSDVVVEYVADSGGQPATTGSGATTALVWSSPGSGQTWGPSDTNWPHLVRLRWRMHDRDGKIYGRDESGTNRAGRWFEQIIKINRD